MVMIDNFITGGENLKCGSPEEREKKSDERKL